MGLQDSGRPSRCWLIGEVYRAPMPRLEELTPGARRVSFLVPARERRGRWTVSMAGLSHATATVDGEFVRVDGLLTARDEPGVRTSEVVLTQGTRRLITPVSLRVKSTWTALPERAVLRTDPAGRSPFDVILNVRPVEELRVLPADGGIDARLARLSPGCWRLRLRSLESTQAFHRTSITLRRETGSPLVIPVTVIGRSPATSAP